MSQFEAFATIKTSPFFVNIASLGVTPERIVLQQQSGAVNGIMSVPKIARLRIFNLSTTAHVAITLTDNTVTTPTLWNSSTGGTAGAPTTPTGAAQTMICSAAGALTVANGIRIGPGSTLELNVGSEELLWIVASAAATPVQVVWFAQNG
jgi:hypothetical protein